MSSYRRAVFANGEIYHIFNRGIAKQPISNGNRDYSRLIKTVSYYQYANSSIRFSHFMNLPEKTKRALLDQLCTLPNKMVEILAWCLMPNHFHLVLRQLQEDGIKDFVSNFCNSYAKYFNQKYDRDGSLFKRPFKAIRVETNEQLIHLSRYIHLNPVASFLIKEENLLSYQWSSFKEYVSSSGIKIAETATVLENFSSGDEYKKFVLDYADYAKKMKKIQHLCLEN